MADDTSKAAAPAETKADAAPAGPFKHPARKTDGSSGWVDKALAKIVAKVDPEDVAEDDKLFLSSLNSRRDSGNMDLTAADLNRLAQICTAHGVSR